MVDIFTGKTATTTDILARLKTAKGPQASVSSQLDPGLSDAAKRLVDILDLSPQAQRKAQSGLKVSGHLDVFSRVLKFLNGFSSAYRPAPTKAEIEFFTPNKK